MQMSQVTNPSTSQPTALPTGIRGRAARGAGTPRILTSSSSVHQEISPSIPITVDSHSGAPPQWLMAGRISRGLPARGGPSRPLPRPSGPLDSASTNPEQSMAARLLIGSSRQDHVLRLLPPPKGIASSCTGPSTSDLEGTYYAAFEEAYEANNSEIQIINLEKMADLSIEKGDILKAAHLLNGALAVALKNESTKKYQEHLFSRLEGLEEVFLEKTFRKKTPASHHLYLIKYRELLQNIRTEASTKLTNQEPAEAVQRFITEQYQRLLCILIEESIGLIGESPPPFAVMGLGSIARMEASPYSDVEFAIIVADEKPKTIAYFRNLSRFLELRITNLGETKLMIVRPKRVKGVMREATSLTPGGFSMDIGGLSPLGKTGVYELIGTPQTLAAFQDPMWFQRHEGELILVNAMTCVSKIYGNENLVKKYIREIQRWLGMEKKNILKVLSKGKKTVLSEHQKRARVLLEGHNTEFKPYLTDSRVALRAFDVKKDLYRPIQMAINGLILYYGFPTQGCIAGIETLRKNKIFSDEGAENLTQALRSVLALRVQAHLFYQKEEEIIYRSQGKDDLEGAALFQLPKDSTLIQDIYRVLMPLHEAMHRFLEGDQQAIANGSFYDDSVGMIGSIDPNDLNYDARETSYLQAAAFNPENPLARIGLGSIKSQRGKVNDALAHSLETLRLIKEQYGETPHQNIVSALDMVGVAYRDSGDNAKAIVYHEESLNMLSILCNEKPTPSAARELLRCVAFTGDCLGQAYRNLGEFKKAIECFDKALDSYKKIFGDTPNINIAKTLSNLGVVHNDSGNSKQAIVYHEQALKMEKQMYENKSHPSIAATLGNLGNAYLKLRDPQQAITYFEQDFAMSKDIYGNTPHHNIAITLNNLGQAYCDLGDRKKGITYFDQSLSMTKRVFGDTPHLDIASTHNNLGSAYYALKDYNRAEANYKKSLLMRKQIYGDTPQLDIAISFNNLGLAHKALGNIQAAITHYDQSLDIYKKIYGDIPHPDIAASLNNLGLAYKDLGNAAKAIIYYDQSLTIRKQVHGDTPHLDIARSLSNLGNAYIDLEDYKKALIHFEECLNMRKQIYGDIPHLDIAFSLVNIARTYEYSSDANQAIAYYESALMMRNLLHNNTPHPNISTTLWDLGDCHTKLGNASIAFAYYERSLAMDELLCKGKPQSEIASTLMNIGYKYRTIKNPGKAIEYFDQAQTIYEQLHSNKPHLTIAQALNFIGAAYRECGNAAKSVDFCLQALTMKITLYGDVPHEEIAFTLGSLGKGYRALGDQENANKSLRKSYEIYKTLKGENHAETKDALALLQDGS